jgi:hypothetical protein
MYERTAAVPGISRTDAFAAHYAGGNHYAQVAQDLSRQRLFGGFVGALQRQAGQQEMYVPVVNEPVTGRIDRTDRVPLPRFKRQPFRQAVRRLKEKLTRQERAPSRWRDGFVTAAAGAGAVALSVVSMYAGSNALDLPEQVSDGTFEPSIGATSGQQEVKAKGPTSESQTQNTTPSTEAQPPANPPELADPAGAVVQIDAAPIVVTAPADVPDIPTTIPPLPELEDDEDDPVVPSPTPEPEPQPEPEPEQPQQPEEPAPETPDPNQPEQPPTEQNPQEQPVDTQTPLV